MHTYENMLIHFTFEKKKKKKKKKFNCRPSVRCFTKKKKIERISIFYSFTFSVYSLKKKKKIYFNPNNYANEVHH
jgi:hypothetical protein